LAQHKKNFKKKIFFLAKSKKFGQQPQKKIISQKKVRWATWGHFFFPMLLNPCCAGKKIEPFILQKRHFLAKIF